MEIILPPDDFFTEETTLTEVESEPLTRKVLTHVPVRKRPNSSWWVRVHPSDDMRRRVAVYVSDDGEAYLVASTMRAELENHLSFVTLHTAITREGKLFLWRVPQPPANGKPENSWNLTHRQIAGMAITEWVRMYSDMKADCYQVQKETIRRVDPEWPNYTFNQLLQLGFQNRTIRDSNHSIVQYLRGF